MHNTETGLRFRSWTLRGVRFFSKFAHMLAVAVHGAELTQNSSDSFKQNSDALRKDMAIQ